MSAVKTHAVHLAAAVVTIAPTTVVIVLAILGGATFLAIDDKISGDLVVGLYTAVLAYVFGKATGNAEGEIRGRQEARKE